MYIDTPIIYFILTTSQKKIILTISLKKKKSKKIVTCFIGNCINLIVVSVQEQQRPHLPCLVHSPKIRRLLKLKPIRPRRNPIPIFRPHTRFHTESQHKPPVVWSRLRGLHGFVIWGGIYMHRIIKAQTPTSIPRSWSRLSTSKSTFLRHSNYGCLKPKHAVPAGR